MARPTSQIRSHEISGMAAGYTDAWAHDLIAVVGKRDVRLILEEYRAIAKKPKLAKRDREVAVERAKAISKYL